MGDVEAQYEAYPYPERDPADEKKRLITGSPSHPLEMDHFLWKGARDWRQPLKVLVAGGGTGDALIQLAQVMTTAGRPYQITYLDLSGAAREIAEARAAVRGLSGITFLTGSLLDAPDLGRFDYIDCCGVLHHLPDPQAGFDALSAALAPDGGLGCMVYAPYGRSGVYPLQEAFGTMFAGLAPQERLAHARAVFERLPKSHPFALNPHLVDHDQGDAGFYDLLLHAQDRPFRVADLLAGFDAAGLALAGFTQPALYDPGDLVAPDTPLPDDPGLRMGIAEKLRGTIKMHVAYAVPKARADATVAGGSDPALVPHLKGVAARALADAVARKGRVRVTLGVEKTTLDLPRDAAPLLARIDGRTPLGDIARGAGLDPFTFNARWRAVEGPLAGYGLLLYSRLIV